jgi:hypothetical protein
MVVYYAAIGAKVQNFSLYVVPCLILVSTYTFDYWKNDRLTIFYKNSPPYSDQVKNGGSYTSSPPYVIMAWFIIN